ncbi:hypothetical protein [Psychrobacter aquaticus]|uniref:Uncharacterized protein n=1 Tax=Psychrobacter aquaticus CMS 56 TaxID=1354303 RepID=U4T5B1_9GAMM|nr:hypothetical protein [Psychrobacter aquaticus]ERL56542.1 hypothetical protein M917_0568 [Psychrobacter aquaticus CMS 56]
MTDHFYLLLFLLFLTFMLSLSVVMFLKSVNKEGGMSDVLREKLLRWLPFDFMEERFNIDRLEYVGLRQVFQHGIREDYFYTNITKKRHFVELKEYIAVRKQIRFYEKKWRFILWVMPVVLMVCIPLLPLQDGVDKYVMLVPLALLFFSIHKLKAMPYREEFLAIQKRILQQIYNAVFDDNRFESIELAVKLRKVNKVKVLSNYYDLEAIVDQMNVKSME